MGGLLFLIAGAYIVLKKEIKISSKRTIGGKAAERLGALYLATGLLPLLMNATQDPDMQVLSLVLSLVLSAVSILTTIYLVLFYKPNVIK